MALLPTAAQMRAMDSAVIDKLGLPGLVLMENAGRGVADIIERERQAPPMAGLEVRSRLRGRAERRRWFRHRSPPAVPGRQGACLAGFACRESDRRRRRVCQGSAFARSELHPGSVLGSEISVWQSHLAGAAVVVDALFGTGLRAQITGAPAAAIAAMNATDALRVSVDIPSGLDADTGKVHGSAVHAHITATMACRKLGLVLDADAPVGRVEVVDLGVAVTQASKPRPWHSAPFAIGWNGEDIARLLPVRRATGHKGTAGMFSSSRARLARPGRPC
jgi:NAD(P)H-hydrate repair Nnr-like enzyme with NAD(P)H-hydrate epimerase domain